MKTYDETFSSVMEKVDEYDKNKKTQRKKTLKIAVPALCVCLLAAVAVFALANDPVKVPENTDKETIAGAAAQGSEMPVMPGGVADGGSYNANAVDVILPETSMPEAQEKEEDTQVPNEETTTPPAGTSENYFVSEQETLAPGEVPSASVPSGNGAFMPAADTDTPGTVDYITLIRDYPAVKSKFRMPAKGQVDISGALWAAMNEYGDDMVEYYVRIDVIGDDVRTPAAEKALCKAEMARLTEWVKSNNYTDRVGIDEYGSINDESDHVYTLFAHCSTNFVKNFPASGEYAYFLSLYDESGSAVK